MAALAGVEIDDKAPYVVRWMLFPDRDEAPDEGGIDSWDDLVAEEERRRALRERGDQVM